MSSSTNILRCSHPDVSPPSVINGALPELSDDALRVLVFNLFLIEIELIYNVTLVSVVQESNSVHTPYMHIYISFLDSFPIGY